MMYLRKKSKAILYITVLLASMMVLACFTTACQPAEAAQNDTQTSNLEETATDARDPEPTPTPEQTDDSQGLVEPDPTPVVTQKPEDEIIAAINEYGLSEIGEAFLANAEDFFGDRIIAYRTDGGSDSYSVLESDLSLVSFSTNQVSCWAPIGLSDKEYEAVVADYIKRIWGIDKIEISKHEVIEQRRCTEEFNRYGVAKTVPAYVYSIKGTMGENKRPFSADLNGEGQLCALLSFPIEVDLSKGITKSEAKSRSLEYLEEWRYTYPEIDVETLILAEEKISLAAGYVPSFAFSYEYRSDAPSADDYDFNCEVKVSAANGALQGFGVVPIVDNIDIISMEEAKSLAKQYVIEKSHAEDSSRLEINSENLHTSSGEIVYSFGVQYTPENPTDDDPVCYYSVRIYAATGKLMSAHITS